MGERTVSIIVKLKDQLSRPLGQVNSQFQAVGDSVGKLKNAFGPLTASITSLVSAFAGLAAIREGLRAAEVQAEAEARLAAALGGVNKEFERTIALTAELQERTTFGDEELTSVAALLAEAGLRGEQLSLALEASVQGASALQRNVTDFTRTLVETFTRGRIPEELTRFVGGLGELDEAALRSGAAFAVVAEQFAGTAEALAETPFGRSIQLSNQLGDIFERLGDVIITLKNSALDALIEGFNALVESLETPEFRGVIRIFSQLGRVILTNLPTIVKTVAAIAAVTVALKAAAIAFALFQVASAVFLALQTPAGLILLAVAALSGAIVALTVDFTALGDAAGEVLDALGSGAISLSDIFGVIADTARLTFRRIERAFLIPVRSGFAIIITTITGLAKSAVIGVQFLAIGAATLVGRAFQSVVQALGSGIDSVTNTAADALALIPGIGEETADAIRTSLGDVSFQAVDDLTDKLDELRDASRQQQSELNREIIRLNQIREGQLKAADAAIVALEASTTDFFLKVADGAKFAQDETAKLEAQQQLLLLRRAIQQASLEDQITAIRTDKNKAAQAEITKIELASLQTRFDAQLISAAEFIDARRELEFGLIKDQLIGLVTVRQGIEEQITAQKTAGEDVSALLRQQITIEERIQGLRFQSADLNRKTAAERIALADEIEAAVKESEQAIQEEISRNNERATQGVISFGEAQEKNRQAVERLKLEIIAAGLAIDELLTDEDQAEVDARLDRLASSFTESFGDIERVSSTVGRDIASNLAPAFEDFFVSIIEGTKSTKQAFRDLLADLVRQIIRFLVNRAITAFLTSAFTPGVSFGQAFSSGAGFIGGGLVPGPNVNADIVPARLAPREFVMTREAVSHYGAGFFRALNQMLVPTDMLKGMRSGVRRISGDHFQRGGEVVPASSAAGAGGPAPAFIVANDNAVAQLLDGGRNAFIRFIEDNRDAIKPILRG